MKRLICFLLAFVLLAGLFPAAALPVHADEYSEDGACPECGAPSEEGEGCNFCNSCSDCHEICDRCGDLCLECHELFAEDSVDEWAPCEGCGRCKSGVFYCSICGKCEDCIDEFCPRCFDDVCMDCHEELSGDADVLPCPDCAYCKQDGTAYCSECGLCADCAEICSDCELCRDCIESVELHCPECDACYSVTDPCEDDGDHCVLCCEAEDYLCLNCGICLEATGQDLCDECNLCLDCCHMLAEELGCYCEDLCWELIDDEHLCADCGSCFGQVDQCLTCYDALEIRCTDCCAFLSNLLGCDCTFPVCINSDDFALHMQDFHEDVSYEHGILPQNTWSMDTEHHWRDCRLCDDTAHFTSRATHRFGSDGRCTVCNYSKTDTILITRQPKDRTGIPFYTGWAANVPASTFPVNTVTFTVAALGRDGQEGLHYQWYQAISLNGRSWTLSDCDDEGEYLSGTQTARLTVSVPNDACDEDYEYYYYCVVTDDYGNSVTSQWAKLTGRHHLAVFADLGSSYRTAEGHILCCVGSSCDAKSDYLPHNYGPWKEGVNAAGVVNQRYRVCADCRWRENYYYHTHNYDFSLLYSAETVTPIVENDKARIYEYETTCDNGKVIRCGVDKNTHWIECSYPGCTFKLEEAHDWGVWKSVRAATEQYPGAGYRICSMCEMQKDWSKDFYHWHTHPVEVAEGYCDTDFAQEGSVVVVYASPVDGKRPIDGGAAIDALVTVGVTTKVSTTVVPLTKLSGSTNAFYFTVPTSTQDGRNSTDYLANSITVAFRYETCTHLRTKVINAVEPGCETQGYTGDTVCYYCEHLMESGHYLLPTGHGNAIPAAQTVYETDNQGNIRVDRMGRPVYILHAEEVAYCDSNSRGCYTGDKVCEDCGEILEKGKYRPALHYYKLINDYEETLRDQLIRWYGLRLAEDPVGGKTPGYSGDLICEHCHAVSYGREVMLKTINSLEITVKDYPRFGDLLDDACLELPDNVILLDMLWMDAQTGEYYAWEEVLGMATAPEQLQLELLLEPAEGYWFRDYEYWNGSPGIAITVNGTRITQCFTYTADHRFFGCILFTNSQPIFTGGLVGGQITSTGSADADITVSLKQNDAVKYQQVLQGNDTAYAIYGVEAGEYQLVVEKAGHITQQHTLTVNGNTVTTDIDLLPCPPATITTQPTNAAAPDGATAKVTLKATGDGLTYEWYYKNKGASAFQLTTSFTGPSYSIVMNASRDGRQVYCVVTDQYGNSVKSNTVTLYMGNPAAITKQPSTGYAQLNSTVKATVKATGDGLTYQWYIKNAGAAKYSKSSVTTATYSCKMTETSKDRLVYCVITDAYGTQVKTKTVRLRLAATITAQPTNAAAPEGKKAVVSLSAVGDGLTYRWYYKDAGAVDFALTSSFTGSTYTVAMNEARNERQVYCVVTDQYGKTAQSDVATLYMGNPATVTKQPSTGYARLNSTVKVTVKATGDGLKYQWYVKNAGASKYSKSSNTTATYSCKMTEASKDRLVYCVITDAYGTQVKTKTVRLRLAATITAQPASVCVATGEKATVSLTAVGDVLTYQWYYKDAGAADFALTSSFTGPTYTVAMNASRNGRQVYCVVTDKYGKTAKSDVVTISMK